MNIVMLLMSLKIMQSKEGLLSLSVPSFSSKSDPLVKLTGRTCTCCFLARAQSSQRNMFVTKFE